MAANDTKTGDINPKEYAKTGDINPKEYTDDHQKLRHFGELNFLTAFYNFDIEVCGHLRGDANVGNEGSMQAR